MSLTAEDKALIMATVPTLETSGDKLTGYFYARMMKHNPEVRKFFNQTHQKDGTQAHALAKAVLMYAKNIDHLEKLGAIAPTIIEKHVALDIHAEEYPIVGNNLIAAMGELLGPDVATPEFVNAWTKAYNQLADILIGAEEKEYKRLATVPGGWSGFRTFVIKRRVDESKDIVSLYLEPEDGKPVLPPSPGQYITLRATIDGQECRRNYSVSDKPSDKGYRITVKNIGAVSGYVHNLKEGDKLELRPPQGHFTIDAASEKAPLVFIAAGIGITPLAAMLKSGVRGKLLYYVHADAEHALLKELENLDNVKYVEVNHSRPTVEDIKEHVPRDAEVYFVGPRGFMASVLEMLRSNGNAEENIKYELFGSGKTLT